MDDMKYLINLNQNKELKIPKIGWDKQGYIYYKGALRAFYFEAILFDLNNELDTEGYKYLNIAGIGKVVFSEKELENILFVNTSDFNNIFKIDSKKYAMQLVDFIKLEDCLKDALKNIEYSASIKRYISNLGNEKFDIIRFKNINDSIVESPLLISRYLIYNKDGFFIKLLKKDKYSFSNKKDCIEYYNKEKEDLQNTWLKGIEIIEF